MIFRTKAQKSHSEKNISDPQYYRINEPEQFIIYRP